MRRSLVMFLLWGTQASVNAGAQELRDLVASSPDGTVLLSFAGRPGICEDQRGWGSWRNRDDHWESTDWCIDDVVRVQLRKANGTIAGVRVHVGGRWRAPNGATDLGGVSAPSAAAYFLALVRSAPVGHRAIHPATLADSSVVWPELLRLADDTSLSARINKEAMNWLGITAGRLFADDESRDDRSEARRHALFSMTQLPADEGIPRLIEISESHPFEYMRRLALFWLGQSGDRRVLPVMQRVFRSRG